MDTFGETKKFYKIASSVFLGGSIIKRGGQNPLEAARYGAKIFHGPNIDNFRDVYKLLALLKISKNFCLFYSLSFATLHYPVSGTPYAYLHAYTFSLIGIMLFFILNNTKQNKLLFFVPLK